MVSARCEMAVRAVLENMNLTYRSIELGEVDVKEELDKEQLLTIKKGLMVSSLLLMDDKKAMLIEKIKIIIIEMIHYSDEVPIVNFSEYLSTKIDHDYTYWQVCFLK